MGKKPETVVKVLKQQPPTLSSEMTNLNGDHTRDKQTAHITKAAPLAAAANPKAVSTSTPGLASYAAAAQSPVLSPEMTNYNGDHTRENQSARITKSAPLIATAAINSQVVSTSTHDVASAGSASQVQVLSTEITDHNRDHTRENQTALITKSAPLIATAAVNSKAVSTSTHDVASAGVASQVPVMPSEMTEVNEVVPVLSGLCNQLSAQLNLHGCIRDLRKRIAALETSEQLLKEQNEVMKAGNFDLLDQLKMNNSEVTHQQTIEVALKNIEAIKSEEKKKYDELQTRYTQHLETAARDEKTLLGRMEALKKEIEVIKKENLLIKRDKQELLNENISLKARLI